MPRMTASSPSMSPRAGLRGLGTTSPPRRRNSSTASFSPRWPQPPTSTPAVDRDLAAGGRRGGDQSRWRSHHRPALRARTVRRLSERTVRLLGVGIYYDYFSAPDDQAAASAFAEGPDDAGFDTVCVKTIDPAVLLGQAVALLICEPVSRVTGHPRFVHLVTSSEAESTWIVTLPDEVRDAMADAPCERLAEISIPWSQAEEFYGCADPGDLADFLNELAALARRARSHDHGLYCHMVL